jgi:hypothetical protein
VEEWNTLPLLLNGARSHEVPHLLPDSLRASLKRSDSLEQRVIRTQRVGDLDFLFNLGISEKGRGNVIAQATEPLETRGERSTLRSRSRRCTSDHQVLLAVLYRTLRF